MSNEYLSPEGVAKTSGYTQVVIGKGSRLVFVSGQTATDAAGNMVGEGDFLAQAEKVFENVRTCLEAAGAGFEHVTKMTTFVVGYEPEMRAQIAALRQRFLPANQPGSTLIGVEALARPGLLIEIEAIAVLP